MASISDDLFAKASTLQWLIDRSRDRARNNALVDGDASWSYAELLASAAQYAELLRKDRGIGPGDLVATVLPSDGRHVRLLHALLLLGAVPVPLHPRLHADEIERRIAALHPALTVHEHNPGPDGPTARIGIEQLQTGADETVADLSREWHGPRDSDTLCILFTSGTSGEAKMVPLSYGNHLASALASAENFGVDAADNWLCPLSFAHAGGFAVAMRSVIYGTAMVPCEGFETGAMLAVMRRHRITHVSLVPTMLRRMLEIDPDFDHRSCPALRVILLGGGPADGELLREAADRGLPVFPSYGLTETASQVATMPPDAPPGKRTTAGKVLARARISIRHSGGGECAPGEIGEICVAGPMVMRGYLGGPAANTERFRDGWFRTGDMGTLDAEGYLLVEMRREDRIVSGGENVSPAAVERALRSHPEIRDAAVVGLPDPEWGQVVGAAVVLRNAVSFGELEGHCRAALAGFQLPRRWIRLDALPLTRTGKVDRREIVRLLEEAVDRWGETPSS